ncbi:MAG: glycosylase [Lachnospiraceae bacterium]|nr:glycosylase [Lachnospiraceae bacterium]
MPGWLKDAVFYEIYPQSFYDSNGDGIGDILGIEEKLDYVKGLGCNAIWLNPCFDSPFMDAGYDVRDYKKVAPRYGTNEDLERLFLKAHEKGMHIILDLVPGHTSDQHEWFLSSKDPDQDAYKNRYVWTDSVWNAPPEYKWERGLADRDGSYMVNFFSSQPALNYGFKEITHPEWQLPTDHPDCKKTVEAVKDVMRFWLSRGADGFRVDMADSLVKNDDDRKSATSAIWREIREMLDREYPEAAFISEWSNPDLSLKAGFHADFQLDHGDNWYHTLCRAGLWGEEGPKAPVFSPEGNGDVTHYLDRFLREQKNAEGRGYLSFITCNHDTPRLSATLTPEERRLASAFLLLMPGAPFVYYGDEIGMRYQDGLRSKEGGYQRTGSRTPMQWAPGKNLGFSTAAAEDLYLPVDPLPDAPTVEAEEKDPDSMLYLFRRVLAFRKKHEELHADGALTPVCAEKGKYPFVFRRDRFLICVNPTLTLREAEVNAELKGTLALLVEGKPGKDMPAVCLAEGKITLGPEVLAVFEIK